VTFVLTLLGYLFGSDNGAGRPLEDAEEEDEDDEEDEANDGI
jgi:hypothetical protein